MKLRPAARIHVFTDKYPFLGPLVWILSAQYFSLVILALAIHQAQRGFRVYTFISGVVTLTAFGLFLFHVYLGVGAGTIERIISYPQAVWLTLFGLYMTGTRVHARHLNGK